MLPTMPAHIRSVHGMQRWRRHATARLLQPTRGDNASILRPLSTDVEGLVRAYPLRAGRSPVSDGGFNIPAWRKCHASMCKQCSIHPDPACSRTKVINALERGWSPAFHAMPAKYIPSDRQRHEHKAALAESLQSDLDSGIASPMPFTPDVAGSTFIVEQRKFTEEAKEFNYDPSLPDSALPTLFTNAKMRRVFNYSDPREASGTAHLGPSVNDCSTKWPIRYPDLDSFLAECGPNTWLASADWRAGYAQCPLADDGSRERLCYLQADPTTQRPTFYRPARVVWGLNSSGSFFCAVSSLVSEFAQHRGINVQHFVDDALICGESKEECAEAKARFEALCEELGVQLNNKGSPPTRCLTFLGFRISTEERTIAMTPARLLHVRQSITKCISTRARCHIKTIKSLCGLLSWCCLAVLGGRARLPSVFAMLHRGSRHVTLSAACVRDLTWWLKVACGERNGSRFFVQPESVSWATLITDAGAHAVAAHTATSCSYRHLTPEEVGKSSMARELLGVENAVASLGTDYNDRIIIVACDNAAACSAVNGGRCGTSNADCVPILHRIADLQFKRNVHIICMWTRRNATHLADALANCHDSHAATQLFRATVAATDSPFQAATTTSRASS